MNDISIWVSAHSLYAVAILLGLAIGVFYGFDGWRGDTDALPFQDSPRVKNLLWLFGPGVAAFFGDVNPTTLLDLALGLTPLSMRQIGAVIAPLSPGK